MSTRGRLTTAYAVLLLSTLVVYGVVVSAMRDSSANNIDAGVRPMAGRVVTTIRDMQRQFLLQPDSQPLTLTVVDSVSGRPVAHPSLALVKALAGIPGYFLVFNNQNQLLYASQRMKDLSPEDQDAVERVASKLASRVEDSRLSLRKDSLQLFLVADTVPTADINVPNISRVVAGAEVSFADLLPQALTTSIILVAPVIFVLSILAAYLVLGGVFQPVDQLINEVEAITDGRSLHRRLPTDPASNDELARLGITVNAMLMRLESSFAALRRFTADASHELKTPLTVLRADVERAMHPSTSRGDRMVALEEALQEIARMSDLVDSLLTLARADEGRFDIYPVPIELEPLVREVYETAVILGEDAGLTLSLPTLENAVVMGDRTRLRQLLLNLVTNAIKYTPAGGRVEVAVTRRSGDEVAITVRDTGIGISASDLPHLFDRFWRADRVRSRAAERGGFGLGLSISQWIVQAHGGTISVQSRLGRGSLFTVNLPAVAATPESSQASPDGTKVPDLAGD